VNLHPQVTLIVNLLTEAITTILKALDVCQLSAQTKSHVMAVLTLILR
jgi:hypothetical protein